MKKAQWMIVIMSVFVLSCGAAIQDYNQRSKTKVLSSAEFELDCPQDQMSVTFLTFYGDDPNGAVTKMGVTGCGKKAVYVRDDTDPYNHKWIMNSVQDQGATTVAHPPDGESKGPEGDAGE